MNVFIGPGQVIDYFCVGGSSKKYNCTVQKKMKKEILTLFNYKFNSKLRFYKYIHK